MACLTPILVKTNLGDRVPVPCNRCPECIARRVSGWSFRLTMEDKRSISAHFITLTYEKPPISPNGFMTLNRKDCQNFFKRLRYEIGIDLKINPSELPPSVKYYIAGEYGGKTRRPHYHAIIFNVHKLSLIEKAWGLGHIHYGQVSGASIGYTLKYMDKPKRIPMHRNDDRIPEFSLMSKRLGANYLSDAVVRYHHADLLNRMVITIEDGRKIAMPRYFKDKLYDDYQRDQLRNHHVALMHDTDRKNRMDDPDYERNFEAYKLARFMRNKTRSQSRDKL